MIVKHKNLMKLRKITVIISLFLIIILSSCSYTNTTDKIKATDSSSPKASSITANITFQATDPKFNPLSDVKIVIVNSDGEVSNVFTTDKNGRVFDKVTVPIDKRYDWDSPLNVKKRGTVTAFAYKKGYCDTIIVEVPISDGGSVQPFFMKEVDPTGINPPNVVVGYNQRLDILSLDDKYIRYVEPNK